MEQYIHLLVPERPGFTPTPQQVEQFIERISTSDGFQLLSGSPWQPGLAVTWPTGKFRTAQDPWTGEMMTTNVPVSENVRLKRPAEIPGLIEPLSNHTVLLSGKWSAEYRPIALFTPDGASFEKDYLCTVSCRQRPEPVTMSEVWNEAEREARRLPDFGAPCGSAGGPGYFTHPSSGNTIEVPGAGCARFWIEFEFGKFIFPRMKHGVDSIAKPLLSSAEESFGVRWAQGCRYC
ncbi:MAG TPA: hypothetical protein VMD92_03685 [Acidobacteriaceae bacterium]|jgi:hypothetical protein|nr:hypothetical protein [Acidobacteriaceae bacterium]